MSNEAYDQFKKMNKAFMPFNEWSKISSRMFQDMAERNLKIMSESVAQLTDQIKRLSTIKKPDEFFNLQKECMIENMASLSEHIQKIMDSTMNNLDEFNKVSTATARETFKKTEKEVSD